MHISVEGNGICFEMSLSTEAGKRTAIVQLDGGQWDYQRDFGGHEWLGSGTLSMGEVLKRAYQHLTKG